MQEPRSFSLNNAYWLCARDNCNQKGRGAEELHLWMAPSLSLRVKRLSISTFTRATRRTCPSDHHKWGLEKIPRGQWECAESHPTSYCGFGRRWATKESIACFRGPCDNGWLAESENQHHTQATCAAKLLEIGCVDLVYENYAYLFLHIRCGNSEKLCYNVLRPS